MKRNSPVEVGKVGILGIQGCIEPHEHLLSKIGVSSVRVRTADDLTSIDRLILPGGESTTMLSFIQRHSLFSALRDFAKERPMWGICAGAILLAREVCHPEQASLGVMDIRAYRNYYGSQLDSFSTTLQISTIDRPLDVMFIRAPHLEVLSAPKSPEPIRTLAMYGDRGVFFEQGRLWASAFHVELGNDTALHEKFLSL